MLIQLPAKMRKHKSSFLFDMARHIHKKDENTNYKLVGVFGDGKLTVKKVAIE